MKSPVSATITRPADTTAYAAGDVIGTATSHILTFENAIDDKGGDGADLLMISRAWIVDSAREATLPSLELWLFTTPPAAQADNTAFAVTDAELIAGFAGVLTFDTSYAGKASDNGVFVCETYGGMLKLAGGASDLYGVLVVRNAYTPISGEQFKVILNTL